MVRADAARLRRKTERQRDVKLLQRSHLAVEPLQGIRAEAVRPAQAGPQVGDAQAPQPADRVLQAGVLEMEPLADPQRWRVLGELVSGGLRPA